MSLCRGLSLALLLLTLAVPAGAQGEKASSPAEFARMIEDLKPGHWVWTPEIAPSGPILIYVDLSKQIALVYRNGVRIAATTVSTGKAGYPTPTGVFTILQKDADHRSNIYDNAPMPFQQRLTWSGVALHAGGLPGYPQSHGCIRLPYEFARQLFAITNLGMTVVIEGDAQTRITTTENSLLSPFDAKGARMSSSQLDEEEFRWTPQRAPNGPLTIIVAKQDQHIVVLRNGVEIGRSIALIDDDDPRSHVLTLVERDGGPQWLYVGLPGNKEDAGRELDEETMNRVQVPRAFYEAVKAELKPGSTILVTNSRVSAGRLKRLTIMDAVVPRP